MTKVSASVLSARDNLKNTLLELNNLDIDYLHLDIMDGEFVTNKSFNYDEIKEIVNTINKPLDVHLMVKNIDEYIYQYAMLNTEYITIHYEAMKDTKIIEKIKSYGIKCGISIKPNTSVEQIYELLPLIDMVLIMSVEPGKGGQEFIQSSLNKVKKISEKVRNDNLNVIISIDGGINNNNAKECIDNGANVLVIGSALVKNENKLLFINSVKY